MRAPILVLEDMPERVDWLRARAQGHPVVWAQTVTEFLALPEWGGDIAVVVLDHDLDLAHGGEPKVNVGPGPDGLTGMDAVERMPVVSCPVLVWSVNTVRSPHMEQDLRRRGMRVFRCAFGNPWIDRLVGGFL